MSKIGEIRQDFSKLIDVISSYDEDIDAVPARLKMLGKTLGAALNEQAAWPAYYGMRRAEIKALVSYMESKENKTRSTIARKYVENYSKVLGDRMINTYIDSDPEYLSVHELKLEVVELYDKFNAIMDALDKRGFALRDTTLARVNDLENAGL
jgi:hypothetical protein